MKGICLLFIATAICNVLAAQTAVTGTIKAGGCGSCVTVYMRPDATNNTAVVRNINFTLSVPAHVTPLPSISIRQNFITGATYDYSGRTGSTLVAYTAGGRYYYDVIISNPAPFAGEFTPMTANMEQPVAEIQFSGNTTDMELIRLHDRTNAGGGMNLHSYWYVELVGNGQVSPNPPAALFYSDPGNSTTGTDLGGDQYAQTTSLVALPVRFTGIEQVPVGCDSARISWRVDEEQGISQYLVEKSTDGLNWATVSLVPPHLNSSINGSHAYTAVVSVRHSRADQRYYLRIKATEQHNRSVYYSPVLSGKISCQEGNWTGWLLSPNPARAGSRIQLQFYAPDQFIVQLRITSISGHLVQNGSYTTHKGYNTWPVHLRALQPGLYLVDVLNEGLSISKHTLMIQ